EGDVAARDRGGARAAVGLDDVAVDDERVFAQLLQVDHRAQRTADETLDLERPAALPALRRLAPGALAGGTRQHAVFGREPAAVFAAQPRRHPGLGAG